MGSGQGQEVLDIGEVARITGVSASALRYYERLGLVTPAGRNGLRRTYPPEALDRIALILNARTSGFSLSELAALCAASGDEVRASLAGKAEELDRRIEELRTARARIEHALTCRHHSPLDCPDFRGALRKALPDPMSSPSASSGRG
ncbi:MerR family transcriptional regulator [Streptomyces sp. NPDC002057]|uniref:MerR family transcriptional regulator n=1 Tax=Streptomyces sp. NPDC002057 TaxID=3154664 RepID=UPI00333172AD